MTTTTTEFELVPVGLGCEHLKKISMACEDTIAPVVIGRNEATFLAMAGTTNEPTNAIQFFTTVSRSHAQLSIKGGVIYLKPLTVNQQIVQVNGEPVPVDEETPISVGDTISLLGNFNYYNYKLTAIKKNSNNNGNDNDSKHDTTISVEAASPLRPAHVTVPLTTSRQGATTRSSAILLDNSPDSQASPTIVDDLVILRETKTPPKKRKGVADVVAVTSSPPMKSTTTTTTIVSDLSPPPSVTRTPGVVSSSSEKLQGHLECAICFNLMSYAHNVVPCGCSFCFECIVSWSSRSSNCPNCQAQFDINNIIHNRLLDNIVREILQGNAQQQLPNSADELKVWEQRWEQGKQLKIIFTENNKSKSLSSSSSSKFDHRSHQAQRLQQALVANANAERNFASFFNRQEHLNRLATPIMTQQQQQQQQYMLARPNPHAYLNPNPNGSSHNVIRINNTPPQSQVAGATTTTLPTTTTTTTSSRSRSNRTTTTTTSFVDLT